MSKISRLFRALRDRIRLRTLALLAALVVSNGYWRRRERIVRESLTVSRRRTTDSPADNEYHDVVRAAREAADLLDASPENLPEHVEAVDAERRERRRELERTRESWADVLWKEGADREPTTNAVRVVVVRLPSGTMADATAIAKRATTEPRSIGVGFAEHDGTFAIGVGDDVGADLSAAEIANRVVAEAGDGGAGGSKQYASGAVSLDDLDRGVEALIDDATADNADTERIDIVTAGVEFSAGGERR